MIVRIWVKNFRMLASNRVDLRRFAVLVGRNASGKSTLMSALRFVSTVLSDGVERAVDVALDGSGASFRDLCFEEHKPIAIALVVNLAERYYRYEIEVAQYGSDTPVVKRENLFLLPELPEDATDPSRLQTSLFGDLELDEVVHQNSPRGARWRKIVGKTAEGKDYFQDEKTDWNNQFRFGPTRSALGNIPEDTDRFPGAIAVRNLLRDGVRMIELDSHKLRMPSPPRSATALSNDGGNLAIAARILEGRDRVAFEQWVAHVADAVPGLTSIDTWERPEDKHVVLRARFDGNHTDPVPSWLLSDGTLRLLALSLLAFAETEDQPGLCLVEEPENGLHPLAIQSVFQALSQMHTTQVFVATHSPVFLAQTSLEEALVFRRGPLGVSQIQRGAELAALANWKERVILPDLFATGVL
ncbi:MAG: AAA family ATPase [Polyangiaceae bacterium]|nr:AAA family ATPase [Polyangiaceae bacterium]